MTSPHLDRWTGRFQALREIQHRFTATGRYDRASRASLMLQRAYERWAYEVLAHCPA